MEKILLKELVKNNKKIFLLACGVDNVSLTYANEKKFRYSILTPYLENSSQKKEYKQTLKYLSPGYLRLSKYVKNIVSGIISSDLDYHIPYKGIEKYLGMIPNPINIDKLKNPYPIKRSRIHILHAINSKNKIKKGNKIFEKSLLIIEKKYSDKIKVITTIDNSYSSHIKNVENCDILLDQVYAYDQGYNALEAMALGKVVFTGAEVEWAEYYKIKENMVAINALPDVSKIVDKLSWLIENPIHLKNISINARKFIEIHHNYKSIALKYINNWKK